MNVINDNYKKLMTDACILVKDLADTDLTQTKVVHSLQVQARSLMDQCQALGDDIYREILNNRSRFIAAGSRQEAEEAAETLKLGPELWVWVQEPQWLDGRCGILYVTPSAALDMKQYTSELIYRNDTLLD